MAGIKEERREALEQQKKEIQLLVGKVVNGFKEGLSVKEIAEKCKVSEAQVLHYKKLYNL